jgi:hypothetical protein
MNSLEQLNNYGQTTISILDQRFATVIFDRSNTVSANDQVLDITSQSVDVDPGVEIIEIVNYATANVRYQVTINEAIEWTPGVSTIQWLQIPNHISYNKTGNTYTLTGLRDANDWESVKSFVWNLQTGFQVGRLWFLDVKVIWFEQSTGTQEEKIWRVYDPDYYKTAILKVSSDISINSRRLFIPQLTFNSSTNLTCDEGVAKQGRAQLNSAFAVSADFDISQTATLNSNFALTATAAEISSTAVANLSSAFTTLIAPTTYISIQNITLPRNFLSGVGNSIFATNTPYVEDPDPSAQITFTITSADGEFGTDYSSSSTFTYTGTPSQINSLFSQIKFYPNVGLSTNTAYTYTQSKVGGYTITRAASLVRNGSSSPPIRRYTLTSATGTWQPLREEAIYTVIDYLMVGAGGGCDSNGAGGGAGQVNEYLNQSITLSSYPYTIGQGGIVNGGAGGSTIFNSITMVGGQAGSQLLGGTSGNGFIGGDTFGTGSSTGGGGGGGAISNGLDGASIGGNGISGAGGTGYASSITGTTRRYGAGGYGTASGNQQPSVPSYTTDYGGGGRSQLSGVGFPTIAAEPAQNGVVIIKTHP